MAKHAGRFWKGRRLERQERGHVANDTKPRVDEPAEDVVEVPAGEDQKPGFFSRLMGRTEE